MVSGTEAAGDDGCGTDADGHSKGDSDHLNGPGNGERREGHGASSVPDENGVDKVVHGVDGHGDHRGGGVPDEETRNGCVAKFM